MKEVTKSDIGVVGLGTMGSNLALNMESRGFHVSGFDLDVVKSKNFAAGAAAGKNIRLAASLTELATLLQKPRRVLMMVPSWAVDSAISEIRAALQPGDILMDGGNSFFLDTERRCKDLATAGIHFSGIGISGGEEGALHGPSIMPGGPQEAWNAVAPVLRMIAAKADDGQPCVDYMGPGGAGHYVKMVHNGIEYGIMQVIAEAYHILSTALGLSAEELHYTFAEWNRGELKSYLIEITAVVLARKDPETGRPLVDMILDEAEQKGTGKWASQNAMDLGVPIPTIDAAVESRILSALKPQRVLAGRLLRGPAPEFTGDRQRLIGSVKESLLNSEIMVYAQGISLLRLASEEYGYGFRPGDIAKIWRAGCIIRSDMLGGIMGAFNRVNDLANLILDEDFRNTIERHQEGWRFTVRSAIGIGIPVPAMSASLAYFDAYRSERLPANLTQAQRDFFGAHTYRRIDKPGVFHTDWV